MESKLANVIDSLAQAPEIQTMYSVPLPVSVIRTRMRQEFERHRFVNKLPVVDVLLFQSNADYQVRRSPVVPLGQRGWSPAHRQEGVAAEVSVTHS